jgi:hypothetical protein
MKKLVVFAALALVSAAHAEKWDRANNPDFFNAVAIRPMVHEFSRLPLQARLQDERLAWSDSYWPSMLGGIAYRWNHPDPQPFKYKLHTRDEVLRMSEAQLSQLSPAELYDISQSDYRYSLTRKVLSKYSPRDLWWEGICHGWALASVHYPEPDKVVVRNRDGVNVPFGSSDVKALLSMHDAWNSKGTYARVGARCSVRGKVDGEAFPEDGDVSFPNRRDAEKPECRDVNAGAFHIVIASMIGLNDQGFVADVDRFNDVWNQPIKAYKSRIVGPVPLTAADLRNGVARKLRIQTTMTYGDELEFYDEELVHEGVLGFVSKEPVTRTPMQLDTDRELEYVLELDANGRIIGGEWITESRPDMLWMKKKDERFMNGRFPLAGLNQIYRPVRR